MPIYEYQCDGCGHKLEVMQRMSDPRLTDCPSCNQARLRKLISAAGFQLKGTGWYETDFKNKGKAPAKKDGDKDAASKSGADKTSDKSADKPAEKTSKKPDSTAASD